MANEKNLIPFSERPQEEHRELSRRGGLSSAKKRRARANIKKSMEAILQMDVPSESVRERLKEMGLAPTIEQGMILSVVNSAMKRGDIRALESIRKMIGQEESTADHREQRARIRKLEAETQRIYAEIERARGADGEKDTQVIIVNEWSEEDESEDHTDTTGD